ncbi:methyltransferase domain-containing protein [Ktedonosporobacter rubrisoli]|uniref:Methyltransferase domain-containing protein n=1 Tax=Ktedonosporobacter rubrisoli TaxID=2509675 RepID=A0A4P6JWM9_KTERU|nr:methyltransferase domain-containing protein [Ktedonosporobacter rubrisoli]QBD79875.1 methyltransferase domain-containing protein [Ktedonosporobacter rubrisoli]
MTSTQGHKELIRREFTQQAQAYAANPSIANNERLQRLLQAVQPQPGMRVLDVATGPGYVAMAFAVAGCEVVGIDLTAAPLAIAEQKRQERGLNNLSFQVGDAENLPFEAQEFDIVISRLAFHHFEDPAHVLSEMTRVCRPQGLVIIEDIIASEFPERAAYHNHFERLRDPSHTRALPLSELVELFTARHLEVEQLFTSFHAQAVEQWLKNAQTPAERAQEVRTMFEQDVLHDLSGTQAYREGGALYFRHRTLTCIGRKLVLD